jgi:hypothetical protein
MNEQENNRSENKSYCSQVEIDQRSMEEEKEDWDIVTPGWEKWWKDLEDSGAQQVSERLVALARIEY